MIGYKVTDRLTLGGNAILESDQYRVGDAANPKKPVGGHIVVNLDGS